MRDIFFLLQYGWSSFGKLIIEINIKILNDSKKISYLNIRKNIVYYLQYKNYVISNHEFHFKLFNFTYTY